MDFVPCPICRRPAVWKDNPDRPFCSERCRLIDLGAWASENYRVAGEPAQTLAADSRTDYSHSNFQE